MPISRTGTISESWPHDLRAKIRCHRQPSPTDQWRGSADSHRKCRWAKTANCIGITEAGGAREKRSRRPRAHNPFAIWRPRSPNQPHKTQAPRHPATGGRACVALTSALEESDVSRPPGQGRPPPFHGRPGRRGVRQASASKANVSRPKAGGLGPGRSHYAAHPSSGCLSSSVHCGRSSASRHPSPHRRIYRIYGEPRLDFRSERALGDGRRHERIGISAVQRTAHTMI
jgi:hypothetical protein